MHKAGPNEIVHSNVDGQLLIVNDEGLDLLRLTSEETLESRDRIIDFQKRSRKRDISMITPFNGDVCFVADCELIAYAFSSC